MIYEINAPAPEGPETWVVWLTCIGIALVAVVAVVGLTMMISNLGALWMCLFVVIVVSGGGIVWYASSSTDTRRDNFYANVEEEFKNQHSLEIFTDSYLSKDVDRKVTFSAEDGKMRYGDVYYDRETDQMVLVERHND